jgi:hypothetical protein
MSDDDDDDDGAQHGKTKILRPNFGDPKVIVDRNSGHFCAHEYVQLRMRSRTVLCRVCREPVDAYEVLQRLALRWENCTYEQNKLAELAASIDELKREESNIKARVRNLHKAAPEPKSKLYFEELMRRIAEINDWGGEHDLRSWMSRFKWLDSQQEAALADAMKRARRRIEDNAPKRARRRIARVVKSEPEPTAGADE